MSSIGHHPGITRLLQLIEHDTVTVYLAMLAHLYNSRLVSNLSGLALPR